VYAIIFILLGLGVIVFAVFAINKILSAADQSGEPDKPGEPD